MKKDTVETCQTRIHQLSETLKEKDEEIQNLKELLQDLKIRQVKLGSINKSLKKEVVKLNSRNNSPSLSRNTSFSSSSCTLNGQNVDKLEYLKIIFLKFLEINDKRSLIPVIGNLLGFSREEIQKYL